MGAEEEEEDILVTRLEKCTQRFVQNVVKRLKYPSDHGATAQCTAMTASEGAGLVVLSDTRITRRVQHK